MTVRIPLLFAGLLLCGQFARGQRDFFELAPISYSDTESKDGLALLVADWAAGRKPQPKGEPLEVLKQLLKQLDIPVESQVMVYSRTSKQNNRIRYHNPRVIYYSSDTYLGYVPGGSFEAASTDPELGPVFYFLDKDRIGKSGFVARDNSCLQCHGTSRTDLVPGLMVRSVFPDKNGHPILAEGTYLTTHSSPLKERWGGWFVTGSHGKFRHMGNTIATQHDREGMDFDYEAGANWETMEGKIDTSKYLRPKSDIVSLMVLEHQCNTQNILTKASMEYRRLVYLQKAIDPEVDVTRPEGMSARSARDSAQEIVKTFLFCDEFDLKDGLEGDPAFVETFEAAGVKNSEGQSLRQLRCYGRLFKNRCSYLIYSKAFESLPPVVRTQTLEELWRALQSEDEEFSHIGGSERKRIISIVSETVKNLPECWKSGQ
ncbi:MAG: hypothetical protein VCA40_12680 [Roseibacillus sp.]|nr:hypothetical protein [Deltaproteobacteria bacterium]MCS5540848.1 hypothetical protein [Roseibacillus sp.]HAT20229.1 hypothetical protein [Verrucomicrobiales bacterium]|tara:strand:+ start:770 stop:2059 length:1290 start_codon:yes stop_codon:yes gene_type:complete